MEKYRYQKDDCTEYWTSRGRWFDYLYGKDELTTLLKIGETIDYFYFTIMEKEKYLKGSYTINITQDNAIYNAFVNLMLGYSLIEVMEEGSPEGKSLCFSKTQDAIQLTFNLSEHERAFNTIEFANYRRAGDTRFARLIPSKKCGEQEFYEMEQVFRYKFKQRLHKMLDELEKVYKEQLNVKGIN